MSHGNGGTSSAVGQRFVMFSWLAIGTHEREGRRLTRPTPSNTCRHKQWPHGGVGGQSISGGVEKHTGAIGERGSQVMKRWYQISISQILVAMALSSFLLVVNLRTRREVFDEIVALNPRSEIYSQTTTVCAGWPYFYFERVYVHSSLSEAPDQPKIGPVRLHEIQPLPFLCDLGIAGFILCVSPAITAIMRRASP